MAYNQSRLQLRQRFRIENQRYADTGADEDVNLNYTLQYALNYVWEWLTATDQGFGVRTLNIVVSPTEVNGWFPGLKSINLPADFRRLIEFKRGNAYPDLVSHSESTWRTTGLNVPGWYLINGPGQTVNLGILTSIPQTMELNPGLTNGESIVLMYAQQPPSLGDPTLATADTTTIDLVSEAVVRLIIARANVMSAPKENQYLYPRVLREYESAQQEYLQYMTQRSGGILRLSRYKKPRTRWQ